MLSFLVTKLNLIQECNEQYWTKACLISRKSTLNVTSPNYSSCFWSSRVNNNTGPFPMN